MNHRSSHLMWSSNQMIHSDKSKYESSSSLKLNPHIGNVSESNRKIRKVRNHVGGNLLLYYRTDFS